MERRQWSPSNRNKKRASDRKAAGSSPRGCGQGNFVLFSLCLGCTRIASCAPQGQNHPVLSLHNCNGLTQRRQQRRDFIASSGCRACILYSPNRFGRVGPAISAIVLLRRRAKHWKFRPDGCSRQQVPEMPTAILRLQSLSGQTVQCGVRCVLANGR